MIVMSIHFIAAVQISNDGAYPIEGQNYTLTCCVSGTENVSFIVKSYQWTKNNGTLTEMQTVSNSAIQSFSPLVESDVGQYTCQITINSSLLTDGTVRIINTHDVGLPKSKLHINNSASSIS